MGLSAEKNNYRLIVLGGLLILIGLIAPAIIEVQDFPIAELMTQSLESYNGGSKLLYASFLLITVNTVRILPNYLGVLLMAEGIALRRPPREQIVKSILLLAIIPLEYAVIHQIYHFSYDFGAPAMALILAIVLVVRIRDMTRSVWHKAMIFGMLLFGAQWLDIVPILTNYGFGRGELSMDIKRFSEFGGTEGLLNLVGISLFFIFVSNSFITARLMNIYTREINDVEKELALKKVTAQLQLQYVENRSLREMQFLVHDLKTPLMTIQGLAGVISMLDKTESAKEYANYITQTVDKMSIMISELLSEDSCHVLSVKELVNYAVAHVPQISNIPYFNISFTDENLFVKVNKIRVARALINILENALDEVDELNGKILLSVTKEDGIVSIVVSDNGKGVKEEYLDKIWEAGFSTKSSSGLGLSFVSDIITANAGKVRINNCSEGGAAVTIELPEVYHNE